MFSVTYIVYIIMCVSNINICKFQGIDNALSEKTYHTLQPIEKVQAKKTIAQNQNLP